jgi:hypothetical protein
VLYSENSSNAFRPATAGRRRQAPENLSGFAAIFDNFKFFSELSLARKILSDFSFGGKFPKKNLS